MRSIRSQFTEQITILSRMPEDWSVDTLVLEKYIKCYTTRAKIIPLGYDTNETPVYSIKLLAPPAKFQHMSFAGVLWHNREYMFISPLKLKQNDFIGFITSKIKPTT